MIPLAAAMERNQDNLFLSPARITDLSAPSPGTELFHGGAEGGESY